MELLGHGDLFLAKERGCDIVTPSCVFLPGWKKKPGRGEAGEHLLNGQSKRATFGPTTSTSGPRLSEESNCNPLEKAKGSRVEKKPGNTPWRVPANRGLSVAFFSHPGILSGSYPSAGGLDGETESMPLPESEEFATSSDDTVERKNGIY